MECRAELDDAALFVLDQVYLEIELLLLGVFAVRSARRAVVLHPLEGQTHLAEGEGGPAARTASRSRRGRRPSAPYLLQRRDGNGCCGCLRVSFRPRRSRASARMIVVADE